MQNRQMDWIFWVATALAFSPLMFAQTATQPEATKSTPDLSGMWILPPGDRLTHRFREEDPPLQPWALEIYKVNRQGVRDITQSGVNRRDPEHYCLPIGVPRVYTSPSPFEIVQVPGRIYMISTSLQNPLSRYIYTDGSGHPEGYPTTFMGHSVGHWDGDTLVVDTIGMDETSWLDSAGTPHSDALHVVERLRRVARDKLEIDFRFEDPKAFTRPWTGKKVFQLEPDWQYIPGIACEDRFKEDFAAGRFYLWAPAAPKPNEEGR